LARLDVAPAIANQPAAIERNGMTLLCLEQHTWLRFATITAIGIGVTADKNIIHCNVGTKLLVHSLDASRTLLPGSYIRLIGNDNHQKAGFLKRHHGLGDAGQYLEILDPSWSEGLTVPYKGSIDDAVAVQENRTLRSRCVHRA
jgi:hypothetical protein